MTTHREQWAAQEADHRRRVHAVFADPRTGEPDPRPRLARALAAGVLIAVLIGGGLALRPIRQAPTEAAPPGQHSADRAATSDPR